MLNLCLCVWFVVDDMIIGVIVNYLPAFNGLSKEEEYYDDDLFWEVREGEGEERERERVRESEEGGKIEEMSGVFPPSSLHCNAAS